MEKTGRESKEGEKMKEPDEDEAKTMKWKTGRRDREVKWRK